MANALKMYQSALGKTEAKQDIAPNVTKTKTKKTVEELFSDRLLLTVLVLSQNPDLSLTEPLNLIQIEVPKPRRNHGPIPSFKES